MTASDSDKRFQDPAKPARKDDFSPVLTAIKAIREKEGKKRGVQGSIPCPTCSAELKYSIASINGHIWGKCSGCGLAWMM